ncbi:Eco57I restriction-modification methylase domain-containing protein [Virgibacillus salexigens]|uniref:site-specific DNA-methyltransferase (adenine-specific) n=1 Tax=Virgibacillus kapii TaxID=1638645 RepID=A0ABQ2DJ56_9BACI|nr:N-6 DNA methylase [Virgibacillus kapii]GGJ55437.1 hypothetical protein GCM10007111_17140 [Virgibacillus kapii]
MLNKERLISDLKRIHKDIVKVYKLIFQYKNTNDIGFENLINEEYKKENRETEDEKKIWNEQYFHRSAYTLINKILFIRICEDKGFMLNEEDKIMGEEVSPNAGQKLSMVGLQKWSNLISNYSLSELIKFAFKDMNKSYNNISLYKEDKYDWLLPSSEHIETKFMDKKLFDETPYQSFELLLKEIIEALDTTRYDFGDSSENVLGDVYEKFMDRETRRALGQFYTPESVIEYILNNTVKKVNVLDEPFVKVLDPSCGSGHFLIMAYDILKGKFEENLEQLQEKYKDNKYSVIKGKDEVILTGKEYWTNKYLHYHILKHCIYGADIDPFALQLTTINLLLKDLNNFITDELNIIECDSLIKWETDYGWRELEDEVKYGDLFLSVKHKNILGETEEIPLSFIEAEEIVKKGKFWSNQYDFIVGNPPYIRGEKVPNKGYLEKNYQVYASTADILTYFVERGMLLLKENQQLGFIISNKFTRTHYGRKLRKFISDSYIINQYKDNFNEIALNEVFVDAVVDASIIIITNKKPYTDSKIFYNDKYHINQSFYGEESWSFGNIELINLKQKIESKGEKLKDISFIDIYYGIKTGFNDAFIINERTKNKLVKEDPKSAEIIKPVLRGRDIDQYRIEEENLYLINTGYDINIEDDYKAIYNHMLQHKGKLAARSDQGSNWYNLRSCDYYEEFEQDKILYGEIINSSPNRPKFYFDTFNSYVEATGFMITSTKDLKLLLAILNSTLSMFYIKSIGSTLNTNGIRYKKVFLEEIPLLFEIDKEIKDEIIKRVDKIISITKEMYKKTNLTLVDAVTFEKYKDEIKILAGQIDILIIKTYGITNEEYLMMLKYVELKDKTEILSNNELSLLSDNERDSFVEKLAKRIPVDKFVDEHIKNKKSLEILSEEYGFEYTTFALLRKEYAEKYYTEDPWSIYQITESQNKVVKEISFRIQDILEQINSYQDIYSLYPFLEEVLGTKGLNEILDVMKAHNISKRSDKIITEILNSKSDTFSNFIKKRKQEKKPKLFVKYDANVYGLSYWSDEIHKKYFIDAIDYVTSSSEEKHKGTIFEGATKTRKKAESSINSLKELIFHDKEDYIELLNEKLRKAFD